ncbi:MAG: hypothetical protein MRK01_07930 [Candidatus Scalindua sp.]|nr:hypothetical protein [Candidatus Scalindua sp.]
MSYWGFPRYVSVGEKQEKSKKKLEQLRKKNKDIEPIIIEGRTLAHTWWGKAWNNNLEGYADYRNRIERGRSYVRCGCVLDLKISEGRVQSLVMGSETKPYSVVIKIEALEKSVWRKIKNVCEGKLGSLQELLLGKFPKALDEIFTAHGNGLFPAPKKIDFDCSCPDWASMCKHVAATLYGVGARLDKDPNLFFALRKIEINDLISETVKGKARELLTKAKKRSSRIIEVQDLSSVFGIELDRDSRPAKKIKAKAIQKEKTPKAKKNLLKTKTISVKNPVKKAAKSVSRKGTKKTSTETIKKTTKDTTKAKVAKKPTKKPKAKKAAKKVSKKNGTKKK